MEALGAGATLLGHPHSEVISEIMSHATKKTENTFSKFHEKVESLSFLRFIVLCVSNKRTKRRFDGMTERRRRGGSLDPISGLSATSNGVFDIFGIKPNL